MGLYQAHIEFETLDQIKAYQWFGNAYHDGPAFKAIDDFVCRDDVTISDKAQAIRIYCDDGMGMPMDDDMTDQEVFDCFTAEM